MEMEIEENEQTKITGEEETKSTFWELVKFVVITVAIVVPFRLWVAQPFVVSGASMEPTYHDGDYLIVNEFSYHFINPKVDEVIVFRYPRDPSKYFIKRVAGVPGETMSMSGQVTTLADKEYYVLGDNRGASSDSRIWGTVPEKNIVGKVFVRLWKGGTIKKIMLPVQSLINKTLQ